MNLSQIPNLEIKFKERQNLYSIFEKKFFFVKSYNIYLTKLHIQQILKKRRILTFNIEIFEKKQNKIKELLAKTEDTTLIIELYKDFERNKNLLKVNFDSFHNVNLIIIGTNRNYEIWPHLSKIAKFIKNEQYDFNDLEEETQNQLLKERTVLFQGKVVPLNCLIKSESFSCLKAGDLETLIKNKFDLEILLKEETNSKDYYIQRHFKRFIQIDSKILENKDFLIV